MVEMRLLAGVGRLLLTLGVFSLLAGAAEAGPKLVLEAKPKLERVLLGDDVEVEVQLRNDGDAASVVEPLRFDAGSLSFEIIFEDGRTGLDRRFLDEPASKVTLAPGKSLAGSFTIPTVRTGAFAFAALYAGAGEPLRSEKVTVTVDAREDGRNEVEVRMLTTYGPLRISLFFDAAPGTVLNFVRLVRAGFYDGLLFHRALRDQLVQGGDPKGSGFGSPGWRIPREVGSDERQEHKAGRLSMARSARPDSAGCQFFICAKDQRQFDKQYAVFGEVRRGLDVVKTLADVMVERQPRGEEFSRPVTQIQIEKAWVVPGAARE